MQPRPVMGSSARSRDLVETHGEELSPLHHHQQQHSSERGLSPGPSGLQQEQHQQSPNGGAIELIDLREEQLAEGDAAAEQQEGPAAGGGRGGPLLLPVGSSRSHLDAPGVMAGAGAAAVGKRRKSKRTQQCLLGWGVVAIALGLLSISACILSVTVLPAYRDKQMLSAVIVSSPRSKAYGDWVSSNSSKTPVYTEYSFFSVDNPDEFLKGQRPKYKEFGPYVFSQRTRKTAVSFSSDGTLVSYVTLTANDYHPELSGPGLSPEHDMVTLPNLPYITAVATAGGSEMDLLRVGTSTGLKELKRRFFAEFLPTLRENSVTVAATKAIAMMQEALQQIYYPAGGVALRWGGGCVKFGRINHCGFGSMALVGQMLKREWGEDLELFSLCLETGLDVRTAIAPSTVTALWDTKDKLGIFNTERNTSTDRYGVSLWLWGDDVAKERIKAHFSLTEYQFQTLRQYVHRIYDSPLVEKFVLKYFVDHLHANERPSVRPQMVSWDSLVWRQWAVGDVIQVLNGLAAPESVNPEDPPELAWYMASVGMNVSNYNTSYAIRWSNTQAECFFNATTLNSSYFQHDVLGLPRPRSSRTPFNRPELREQKLPATLPQCLPPGGARGDVLGLVRGYIDHVALHFVKPVFEADVIKANGGLLVTQSVATWLYGRQEPVLKLGLDSDDPRARWFSFLGPRDETQFDNARDTDPPPRCLTSSDMDNSYSACRLVLEGGQQGDNSSGVIVNSDGSLMAGSTGGSTGSTGSRGRYYVKVPNTYYTGAGPHPDRMGGLHLWHGDATAWGIWPNGPIPITGGAREAGSRVQYAWSEGTQFPPLNAISPTSAPSLWVFLAKFALPLRFVFSRHVEVQGIDLLRYRLDPLTFSPSRPDAHLYSMDVPPLRPGLFNLTDSTTAPTYLSPLRYAGYPENADKAGLPPAVSAPGEGGEADGGESFLDVEPYTGRTMNVRIGMQLSVAIRPDDYSVWYPHVADMPVMPVMALTQRASVGVEDAAMFKRLVLGSAKLLDAMTYGGLGAGLALIALGVALLLAWAAVRASRVGRAEAAAELAAEQGPGRGKGEDGGMLATPKSLEMVRVQSPPRVL